MPFIFRWSRFAAKLSDVFPKGAIIWDKEDVDPWIFRQVGGDLLSLSRTGTTLRSNLFLGPGKTIGDLNNPVSQVVGTDFYSLGRIKSPRVELTPIVKALEGDPSYQVRGSLVYIDEDNRVKYFDGTTFQPLANLNDIGAPVAFSPFREFVATADVSYVDFTDLDINCHKCYLILLNLRNPTGTGDYYKLYVEGDYNDSNYRTQVLYADGTTVGASRNYQPQITYGYPYETATACVYLFRDPLGYPKFLSMASYRLPFAILTNLFFGGRHATVDNITRIRIYSGATGGIGAGSRIMLFRLGG
jgi:hypothetical protein